MSDTPPPRAADAPRPPARVDRLRLRAELARKTIHVASVAVPAAVWLLPRGWALAVLVAGVVGALSVELARRRSRWVRYVFLRRTRSLLRGHERERLAGATWMAIAYLLAFLVFPRPVAVAAMLYNGLGDAAAAIVGKRWGRHRTRAGKSWEGAAAAFAVNLSVGIAVPGLGAAPALVGAAGAALVEMAPVRVDDNLRVTLIGGATLWAATVLA